jgi:ElaB/YqjD/DUF883 family membrane-anchored ribosome-binding protein
MENSAELHDDLTGQAEQVVSNTKSAFSAATQSTADAVKNALVSADDFVHENPWIAIGVVAGVAGAVGFLAGLATAPKSRFWR